MNLKEMRTAAGLSQMELADALGINQTAISQWERGSTLPSSDKLPKLAELLHCTIDELYKK